MNTYRADFSAVKCLQILFALAVLLIHTAAKLLLRSHPLAVHIVSWSAAAIALTTGFLLLPLFVSSIRCDVTSAQITLRCGILFRREQSILLQNVQFVQIIRGPLDGKWGMNFLMLHVYGGRLIIPFLSRSDRLQIAEFLRKKGVFHAP